MKNAEMNKLIVRAADYVRQWREAKDLDLPEMANKARHKAAALMEFYSEVDIGADMWENADFKALIAEQHAEAA